MSLKVYNNSNESKWKHEHEPGRSLGSRQGLVALELEDKEP